MPFDHFVFHLWRLSFWCCIWACKPTVPSRCHFKLPLKPMVGHHPIAKAQTVCDSDSIRSFVRRTSSCRRLNEDGLVAMLIEPCIGLSQAAELGERDWLSKLCTFDFLFCIRSFA